MASAFEETEEGTDEEDADFRIDCLLCQCLVYHILKDSLNARRTLKLVQEFGDVEEITFALEKLLDSDMEIMFKKRDANDSLDLSNWSWTGSS